MENSRLSTEDNGIGIRPEHLPHLFEQFYRVDEARDLSAGGTGLGLSIVKALVDRMNGRISVRSTPGKGTCFTVEFQTESEANTQA